MSWRYLKAARDHRIWPTLVNWLVTSIKTSEAMQSQTIPKETFIIVIFGGMIRRYDSGYGSGYDSWVWFAELELPTLTKICTPEKKTQPYIYYTYTVNIKIFQSSSIKPGLVDACFFTLRILWIGQPGYKNRRFADHLRWVILIFRSKNMEDWRDVLRKCVTLW